MPMQFLRLHAISVLFGVAILTLGGAALADPPSRVARLGYLTGTVEFSPAGEDEWMQANINRPLTAGDRLWADSDARAEIQVGGATLRMSAGTAVSILNLDDRIAQLQLTQGTLHVRVRRLGPNQTFEVDTPNLAFTMRSAGTYRIDVDPDGDATTIMVRRGRGEAYGEGAAYAIDSRRQYRFTGTGLRDVESIDSPRLDEFDRWADERDRRYDNSPSARYVSPDVVGYQDLDANGTWRVDATYGNVWYPNRVSSDWAPYRDGHWAWVDPWGWTWVDDAPWGFAVSHYGRWANLGGNWGWVPGPARSRAYYAPALVAFVGGSNFQLTISSGNVGGVAWFPLGPREVYRPSYPVSRGYFENVNRSNTVINNTVINNYYNNTNVTNVVYANQQVAGAIVAVPTTAFVQSQPVSRSAVRVTRDMVASAPVAAMPFVAPTATSVQGGAAPGRKPPPRAFERAVAARTAPPPASVGFAAQQQQLAAQPGKPLDTAARRNLKPVAAAPAPVVRVVTPATAKPPTAPPVATKPAARADDGPGRSDDRKPAAQPAAPAARRAEPRQPEAAPQSKPTARQKEPRQPDAAPQPKPAARQVEPRQPDAAPQPKPAARQAEPRQPDAVAKPKPVKEAQPRGPESKPAADKKPKDDKGDKQDREDDKEERGKKR